MDYVLYAYAVVVCMLVLLAAALGRHLFVSIAEPVGPSYREGSPSWRAQQEREEAGRRVVPAPAFFGTAVRGIVLDPEPEQPSADQVAAEVEELERQLARVTAPEVEGATIVHWEAPPTYVQAELDRPGAENWGDLLTGMSTEEQTIYNLQMVLDHEAHMGVEREFLSELDRTVNRVLAELATANEEASRREAYWRTAAARRGVTADLPTGAWPVLQSV